LKWTGTHLNTVVVDTDTLNSSFMEGISLLLWLLKFCDSSTGQHYHIVCWIVHINGCKLFTRKFQLVKMNQGLYLHYSHDWATEFPPIFR